MSVTRKTHDHCSHLGCIWVASGLHSWSASNHRANRITTTYGDTRVITARLSDNAASVDSAWSQATAGLNVLTVFSEGDGACPGRVRENKIKARMALQRESNLATNTGTRDATSTAMRQDRANNLALAASVASELTSRVSDMATIQTNRRTARETVTTALTNMATRVTNAHTTAKTAADANIVATQARYDAAMAAKNTEATRVHTLKEHQLEQHNTDVAMMDAQRASFAAAQLAQANALAGAVRPPPRRPPPADLAP